MGPLLASLLALSSAQSVKAPVSDPYPGSLEELARDLRGNDASRRRFAIREMNRTARVARKHEFGPLDSDRTMDAIQKLEFLDDHAAPTCLKHLQIDLEVRGCARLLGHLETSGARRILSEARSRTTKKADIRAIDRTLRILEAAAHESAP
mgnify:CR=1 FL=1